MMFLKTPVIFALLALLIGPRVFADYPATVLASNPLAYYRFEEGPGATTLVDSSGNGLDIDNSNPVGTTLLGSDGAVGSAVTFNGDGYLVSPLNLDTSVGDFTIEAIIKRTAGAPEGVVIANQDGNLGPGRSNLVVNGEGLITTFSGGATTNSGIINTGEDFDHVILTFDQSAVAEGVDPTFRFFINGAEAGIGTAIPEAANGSWVIGANKRLNYQFFNGVVDDVAIYGSRLDDPNGDGDSSDSKIGEHYIGFLSDSDDLNKGLVAYYPFNGNANDESGNGIDGITDGPSLATDRSGRSNSAYAFDGNSAITANNLELGKYYTVSAWFNSVDQVGVYDTILSITDPGTPRTFVSIFHNSQEKLRFVSRHEATQSGGANLYSEENLHDGAWHQVICIKRTNLVELYVDGVKIAETEDDDSRVITKITELNIGYNVTRNSQWDYTGLIDDIRIYNRALSNEEISSLYALESQNSQFQIVEGNFTWQEAKADAEAKGGRLAVLNTQAKIDQVIEFLSSKDSTPILLIGLSDEDVEGDWRWITGEPLILSRWGDGEPNNAGDEDYGSLHPSPNHPQPFFWNDGGSDGNYSYLLEILDQTPAAPFDADQDGLPDKWEIKYGLSTSDNGSIDPNNGPNGDPDGDGLTNLEENEIGTDPTDSDSDGDGLSDAVEDNGGEFISLTQTGTNPLVADTDGDGLSDGVENPLLDFLDASQPGTDPNNEDSDKDGVNDGAEIGLGQNPTKFKIPTLELSNFYESAPNQPLEISASNSSNQISGTTYQWYFNGFQIPANFGGTSPQITFDGTSNSEGSWSVTATNSSGEETATLQYRVFVDTDLDGLSDYREQNLTGTNFELADTDGDGLNDKLEYEGVTNPNLADSDEDGLSDGVEINQTQTDPTIADTDQDGIVDGLDDQDGDGLSNKDEIGIYGTSPLLADTDGDSIDDKTELEILSDPNTATTTEELITIIRGMATIQSTDSDGDGLTDVKEAELESDSGTATTFYLSDVYDDAVESALVRGRGEVTSTPQNFNLISTAAYAALQVECDSRFLDTDGDGLTDQKEKELESDSSIETTFYLTEAYDEAVNSALISGRSEVTSSPQNFDLISTVAYNALQLQRDADLADYSETLAQKDGVIGTLNNSITAKDAAYALVVTERDRNLETYTATLAAKDGVIGTLNNSITAKDAAYALVVTERDRNLETYTATLAAKDGVIGTLNDSITTKDAAYVTVVAERDARPTLAAYEAAVAESREAGQSDVTSAPATFGLFTSESYNMVIAERDARFVDTDKDGLTDVKEIELETDSTAETIFYLQDVYDLGVEWARFDGRSDVTNNPNAYSLVSNAQYNAVIAQRDARPTQVAFAKVIAERDARPTLGEVKDARLGSVVLQPDGANQSIKIRFSIEETDDFRTWIKRDGINEVTVPLEAGSKFYRFALQDE